VFLVFIIIGYSAILAILKKYPLSKIQVLEELHSDQIQLMHNMKMLFNGTISTPDTSFNFHLEKYQSKKKELTHSRNEEWKNNFLNRLAPLKIIPCLQYPHKSKKGGNNI
jgi:hypothetical protein